jgi:hypothetical protein
MKNLKNKGEGLGGTFFLTKSLSYDYAKINAE